MKNSLRYSEEIPKSVSSLCGALNKEHTNKLPRWRGGGTLQCFVHREAPYQGETLDTLISYTPLKEKVPFEAHGELNDFGISSEYMRAVLHI